MRAKIFSVLFLGMTAFAGCYNTGDLGPFPYKCSDVAPDCPDNYVCDINNTSGQCKTKGSCVCIPIPPAASGLTVPANGTVAGEHVTTEALPVAGEAERAVVAPAEVVAPTQAEAAAAVTR